MKDHIYRPRRLPSIFGPACLAGRETAGRRIKAGWRVEP